ncbi:unnamed protein product [Boreogadus saida]
MRCYTVIGRHPTCNFLLELERDQAECSTRLKNQNLSTTATGLWCRGVWDNIACWEGREVGEVVTISCPPVLRALFQRNALMQMSCCPLTNELSE